MWGIFKESLVWMINQTLYLTREKWKQIALEVSDINNRLRQISKECFVEDYGLEILDKMYDEIADHVGHMYLENRN